jgi:hypothetical protein
MEERTMGITKEAAAGKVLVVAFEAIEEAIRAAGSDGVPSGHIYAQLMPFGCSEELYNRLVDILIEGGCIRRDGSHRLYSVKPLGWGFGK